ncbi:hypothetical protein IAR50_006093 [Cryptococcus sp. DSM 104548]
MPFKLPTRLSWKTSSSQTPPTYADENIVFRHTSATTDDITLQFPAKISYKLDTRPSTIATLLSKPDPDDITPSTDKSDQLMLAHPQKRGWMVESGQDWYLSDYSVQAQSIGAQDSTTVSALEARDPIEFPMMLGDVRESRFSGSWVTRVPDGTKATDPTLFQPTEREFFQDLEKGTGDVYELLSVEIGDEASEERELSRVVNCFESKNLKKADISKVYKKAKWSFRAQLSVPSEGNVPEKKTV